MLKRKSKVLFTESGRGNKLYRITIPYEWLTMMGIDKSSRQVELTLMNEDIIIKKDSGCFEEKRKVVFSKSGKNSRVGRVSIPIIWIIEMGVTPLDRSIEIEFTEDKFVVVRKLI